MAIRCFNPVASRLQLSASPPAGAELGPEVTLDHSLAVPACSSNSSSSPDLHAPPHGRYEVGASSALSIY